MKTTNQSPRCARASSSILRYGTVLLLGAAIVAAQGRIARPPAQTNSNSSGKRPHVATLRSSDSSEGSRVALSSDQSLNDYEAYRRGDRFYVRIPAADVPRAEAIRGRGFADVKTQRTGDSTVISFRLQPGATARVEQRGNRLEVVFKAAGGNSSIASNTGRQSLPTNTGRQSLPSNTGAVPNRNSNTNQRGVSSSLANKNAADRSNSAAARTSANSNLASKAGPSPTPALNSGLRSAATPLPSPIPSPSAKAPTPTPSQKSSSTALASPTTQTTLAAGQPIQARQDRWSQMKERINYWILLAQLNPVPVATGVVVFLLLVALFLFQRRRAKSPKRVRSGVVTKSTKSTTAKDTAASVPTPAESKSVPEVTPPAAVIPSIVAAAPIAAVAVQEVVAPASTSAAEGPRRERIAQVAEETKKLMNGGAYDESVIGSSDRDTRQLVGAELLSAIVGRSATRRENARAAFMKHGYFDDATRDLRVADSPNERAAAARRLSFVHDPEATPHLVGALDDASPDVRRAAVEALMDIRDPAAIGPLNSLMQTENDRKVPRTLIKHAIEACATAAPDASASVGAATHTPEVMPDPSSQSIQTEREVIEL